MAKQTLSILYEDNHIIAVDKRPGDLSQGDKTGDAPLAEAIKAYLKEKYNKPGNVFLGVVHRLDRPVSGVVLFARTSKALTRLTALFREREVEKTYWALVEKRPQLEHGHLIHYLEKDEKKNKTTAYKSAKGAAKRAELNYFLKASIQKHHLLEVHPLTGRPHQIRVQLATLGCPIVGDVKYGYPLMLDDQSIALHARKIVFTHPVKQEHIEIEAPLPLHNAWNPFRKFEPGAG